VKLGLEKRGGMEEDFLVFVSRYPKSILIGNQINFPQVQPALSVTIVGK